MKQSLNQALREHLDAKQLTSSQLERLQSLQQESCIPAKRRQLPLWFGSAAVVLMVLTLTLVWQGMFAGQTTLVEDIAAEVVKNHLNRKPLEINTAQISDIRRYFTRLQFKPIASRYLTERGLILLGGRYCSLQGIAAAQLRFKSLAKDDVHTLYEVGYDPKVFSQLPNYDQNELPLSTWSRGIKVTLWVEKGVLFALTEESDLSGDH